MGIVGVKSTAGREVKFIDPSKTTRSESAWLGYPLCDFIYIYYIYTLIYHILYIYIIHYTMKNEGWGFKEDQIPSSSH